MMMMMNRITCNMRLPRTDDDYVVYEYCNMSHVSDVTLVTLASLDINMW